MYVDAIDIRRMSLRNKIAIQDWVREHGLEPHHVWSINDLGPFVRVRMYQVNEDGEKLLIGIDQPWLYTRWLRRRKPFPKLTL